MKIRSISIIQLALLAVVGTLVLCGCQRDTIVSEYDGILRLCPSVDKLSGVSFKTKGTLINENGSQYPFSTSMSFFVRAYDATAGTELISGTIDGYQEVKMVGTQWNTVYTKDSKEYCQEYLWKPGEKKTFYAYANLPTSGANVTNTDASVQTLTYTVPSSTSDQTDILLGYYSGDGKTGEPGSEKMTGTASIHFYHPLTAVTFRKGTITEGYEIASISIDALYSEGMTTQSSATNVFAWTKLDGTDFTEEDATMEMTFAIDEAALLIPQTFSASSKSRIKVVLKDADDARRTLDLYYPLNTNIGEESTPEYTSWKAGYTYTYEINITGEFNIEGSLTIELAGYENGGIL